MQGKKKSNIRWFGVQYVSASNQMRWQMNTKAPSKYSAESKIKAMYDIEIIKVIELPNSIEEELPSIQIITKVKVQ